MAIKQKFIDQIGLAHLWSRIQQYVSAAFVYATDEEIDEIVKDE